MKAFTTTRQLQYLAVRWSTASASDRSLLALVQEQNNQAHSGLYHSNWPAWQQLCRRGFASNSDTQQYVAQGDPKAPPIAKTKDADNDAKAASAPTQRKGVMSKSKKRNLTKQRQKARQLAAASPETAAAAPLSEQPQQAEAAVHQEEVLTKMQASADTAGAADEEAQKAAVTQSKNQRKNAAKTKRKQAAAAERKPVKQELNEAAQDATVKLQSIKEGQAAAAPPTAPPQHGQRDALPGAAPAGAPARLGGDKEQLNWRQQRKRWQAAQQQKEQAKGPDTAQQRAPLQPQQQGRTSFRTQQNLNRSAPTEPAKPVGPTAEQIAAAEEASRREDERAEEELTRAVQEVMYSMTAPAELGEEDVNLYAVIDNARIPEAFPPFYKGSLTEDGGCKGLQDELKYTSTDRILYRSCIHSLHQKAAGQKKQHAYLDGPAGCGKSIALASLVAWARSQGWLVMYIPRGTDLIEGGTFTKGEDNLWETPEVARLLLKSMVASHEKQLADLPGSSGESLLKLVQDGISANKPSVVTKAAVDLVNEMGNTDQMSVLVAVDDYNVLYSHANYHEWMSEVNRRQIQPHELRLASALRILEKKGPKRGMFVGAASHSGPVSPKLQVPRPQNTLHMIPKLQLRETRQQFAHYYAQGLSEEPPEVHALEYAYFMTGGSPKGLRLHRRSLIAGQASAEVMNSMLNRYQYMLGSSEAQETGAEQSISA